MAHTVITQGILAQLHSDVVKEHFNATENKFQCMSGEANFHYEVRS